MENKEIINQTEETSEVRVKKNIFKSLIEKIKSQKSTKLRNQALLKRGGYSLGITALVLAAIIIFNLMVSALSSRFHLEFDLSAEKQNSMSEENIEYIKSLDDEVTVTVCGAEDSYASYAAYYAQYQNSATGDEDYFKQTVNLVNKYEEYGKNITVKFVDPQSTEFTEVAQKYSTLNLSYGDIIVSSVKNDNERIKHIGFEDIYSLTDESGYAASGYGYYTISGNKIETALTSAIAYVASSDTKKVAFLTGHSTKDYTSSYVSMLETNNYEVTMISDALVTSISDEYDAIIIMAPDKDFVGEEIDAISRFLENDGKLNKGLLFFADASCPTLPNLSSFLQQWGIQTGEGMLFETDSGNHISGDPTTMGVYPTELEDDDIIDGMEVCITGYNVPLTSVKAASADRESTVIMETPDSVAIAPVGATAEWSDYTQDSLSSYGGVIQSRLLEYNSDNEEMNNYVFAFGSVEYIQSQYAEYTQLSNKNIVLACTDRAANVEDAGISFVSKVIENESFADSVTEAGTNVIRVIFMLLLPVSMIVLGIYIYIRRKNA